MFENTGKEANDETVGQNKSSNGKYFLSAGQKARTNLINELWAIKER